MSLLRYGRRAASCHAGETDRVSLANAWSAKWASSTPAGISRKRQGSSSCKKIQRSSSVIHGSPTGLAFSHAFLCFLWPKARVKGNSCAEIPNVSLRKITTKKPSCEYPWLCTYCTAAGQPSPEGVWASVWPRSWTNLNVKKQLLRLTAIIHECKKCFSSHQIDGEFRWYTGDILVMYWWLSDCLTYWWYTGDMLVQVVYWWYTDNQIIYWW